MLHMCLNSILMIYPTKFSYIFPTNHGRLGISVTAAVKGPSHNTTEQQESSHLHISSDHLSEKKNLKKPVDNKRSPRDPHARSKVYSLIDNFLRLGWTTAL